MLRRFYKTSIACFYITMGLLILGNIAYAIYGDERMKGLESLPLFVRLPIGFLGAFSAVGIITLWLRRLPRLSHTSELPVTRPESPPGLTHAISTEKYELRGCSGWLTLAYIFTRRFRTVFLPCASIC